jgi:GGDEF domain-containing protein
VYQFRLLPKFYQTAWFRLLAVLGFCFAGWKLYLIRVRYLMERNQELEEKVQSRTAELLKAVEAAEMARELLREQATRDTLTGLWNRRAIFAILESELARCGANSGQLCVLMVDLDHFKSINDGMGHLAGDQVLQQAASRLRHGVRENEAVGRYGGEEILIVLPECTLSTGLKRAEMFGSPVAWAWQAPVRDGPDAIS